MPCIGELSGCPQSPPPSISARTHNPPLKWSLPGKRLPPFVAKTTFRVPLLSRKRPSSSNLDLKSSSWDMSLTPLPCEHPPSVWLPIGSLYQAGLDWWYVCSSECRASDDPDQRAMFNGR